MRSTTADNSLRLALDTLAWSDTRLAAETGIHITLIRRYLKGQVEIGKKNGIRVARALGIPLETVLYGPAPGDVSSVKQAGLSSPGASAARQHADHGRGWSCFVTGDEGQGICPACLREAFQDQGEACR